MPGSYRVDCESCGDSISAAARYCAWCGTEQQRAVDAIERMRTDGGSDSSEQEAEIAVANARSLLSDFEDVDTEVRHGAIDHAIDELRNARRALPDDY